MLDAAAKPAWIVYAWPPVLWQPDCTPELRFVHLGTRVLACADAENRCIGQTLWGEDSHARSAGVAWDWVEIGQGVVAMADPFGLVTNLRLLGADGGALPPSRIALHLHTLVYGLPWQCEVRRALCKSA